MDDGSDHVDTRVIVVDVGVWRLVDAGSVRALVGAEFEVLDREPDGADVAGAIVATLSSDAVELASLRRRGAVGVVTVTPTVSIREQAQLVASALSAGADFCLIRPAPVDFVAHVRALARRLRSP